MQGKCNNQYTINSRLSVEQIILFHFSRSVTIDKFPAAQLINLCDGMKILDTVIISTEV